MIRYLGNAYNTLSHFCSGFVLNCFRFHWQSAHCANTGGKRFTRWMGSLGNLSVAGSQDLQEPLGGNDSHLSHLRKRNQNTDIRQFQN